MSLIALVISLFGGTAGPSPAFESIRVDLDADGVRLEHSIDRDVLLLDPEWQEQAGLVAPVGQATWHSLGTVLTAGGLEEIARLRELESGEVLWQFTPGTGSVWDAKPLPEDRTLVVVSRGGPTLSEATFSVEVVDRRGHVHRSLTIPGFKPQHAEPLPNGNWLLSGGTGDWVRMALWYGPIVPDGPPGRIEADEPRTGGRVLEVTPDGQIVWKIDRLDDACVAHRTVEGTTLIVEPRIGRVSLHDRSGRIVRRYLVWATDAAQSPDGGLLLIGIRRKGIGTPYLAEIDRDGQLLRYMTLSYLGTPSRVEWVAGGRTLLTNMIVRSDD